MTKMMITIGAAALMAIMASAQGLPTPTALPSPDVQTGNDTFSVEDLAPGAECRVFGGAIFHRRGTSAQTDEHNYKRIAELFRGDPKGIVSKYDDGDEFSAVKIGVGVAWNVATWKGYLKSPQAATVTFISTGSEPYIISINGKVWKGRGQSKVEVPIKKGFNEVKIGKVSLDSKRSVLRIQYRTTEFGQYMDFSPRNLYHEVNEDKGFSFDAW